MPAINLRQLLNLLLIFVPLAAAAQLSSMPAAVVFVLSCLAIVPLASLLGQATESLSQHLGEGAGALLTASCGNAAELIIGLTALHHGLIEIVQASITGSIIGNVLLVLGGAILCGGVRHQTQTFNRTAASTSATLLALAAISLIVPAFFHFGSGHISCQQDTRLGLVIACVLFVTYLASLWFTLKTHRHLYTSPCPALSAEEAGSPGWSIKKSAMVLVLSTIFTACISELLSGAIEPAARSLGMNQLFIGVVILAIIGNVAEHTTAITMAMKNKMDLCLSICLGSSTQIALFVAPILVFISQFLSRPITLCFSQLEVLSIGLSVIILSFVAADGECNWLEGFQLLAVYVILCTAFYFAPG